MANNLASRVVDLDVACLICLNEETGHSSIYSHDLEPPHTLIADKIRCCTNLQLENLKLQRWPDKICEQCHSELTVAYRLYEKCVLIDKLFLSATNSGLLVDVDELDKNQQLKLDLEQHHVKLPSSLKIKRVEFDSDIPPASRTVVGAVSAAPRAIAVPTTGSGSTLTTAALTVAAATKTAGPNLPVTKMEYFQGDREDSDSLGLLPDASDSLVMSLDNLIETVPMKEQPVDAVLSDEENKKMIVSQPWDEDPPTPEHAYEIETPLSKETQEEPQDELPPPPPPPAPRTSRALNTIQRCNISKRTYKRVTPIFKREVDNDDDYVLFDSQQIVIPESRLHAERARKICHVCGNTYKYQHALNAHMRRHNNERPYPCEVCQKAFISNVELRRHMRVHTGQKPYGCRYCDRRFSDFGSSKKHERIHTGERPYVCEVCHKGFAYAHVLTVHRRTHTGKKQFQCTQCDKGFTKKSYLAAHLDQHNGATTAAPTAKRPAARKLQKSHVPETLSIGQLMLGAEPTKVLEECIVTHDFMFNEEDDGDADDHDLEAAGEEEAMELDDADPEPEHDDFEDVDVDVDDYHQSVRSVKDDPYALVGDLLDSEEFADDSKYLID